MYSGFKEQIDLYVHNVTSDASVVRHCLYFLSVSITIMIVIDYITIMFTRNDVFSLVVPMQCHDPVMQYPVKRTVIHALLLIALVVYDHIEY